MTPIVAIAGHERVSRTVLELQSDDLAHDLLGRAAARRIDRSVDQQLTLTLPALKSDTLDIAPRLAARMKVEAQKTLELLEDS